MNDAAVHDRIASLEQEVRRAFEEAQREADAMFAQYQLSQLLASGGRPVDLANIVLAEIVRLCGAAAGALWLSRLVATGAGGRCGARRAGARVGGRAE